MTLKQIAQNDKKQYFIPNSIQNLPSAKFLSNIYSPVLALSFSLFNQSNGLERRKQTSKKKS